MTGILEGFARLKREREAKEGKLTMGTNQSKENIGNLSVDPKVMFWANYSSLKHLRNYNN